MNLPEQINSFFRVPALSRARMILAMAIAVATDGLQFVLGPLGWVFVDPLTDFLAMALISRAVGFHILLLPTFAIKLIPIADELPTWTACTAAVIALRLRDQRNRPSPAEPPDKPPDKPIIDV